MQKRSKLLTVVSIIIIVFSCMGILANIMMMAMGSAIEAYLEGTGVAMPGMADYAFAIVLGIVQLIAGIAGAMQRSKKSVLIMGALYCLLILVNVIISCVSVGFSFTYVFSFILPILYMWGWYQAE